VEIDREQILGAFLEESREQLDDLEQTLIGLESRPDDGEAVRSAFRALHTLKGSAASLGFPDLAEYAHEVESILEGLRDRSLPVSRESITPLLRVVDLLQQLVPSAVAGSTLDLREPRVLLRRLEALRRADAPAQTPGTGIAATTAGEPTGRRLEGAQRTLRVEVERLDRLLSLVGEMAVLRSRQSQLLRAAGRLPVDLQEVDYEIDTLFLSLHEEILRARMVPIQAVFRRHLRTVRDTAQTCGKLARLRFEGGEIEVDTSIVEHLRDPLTQMVRNAVDHGIESPPERRRAGKDPCGTVTLHAIPDGANLVIEVVDDGAGLQRERIAARAKECGLHPNPEGLDDESLFLLILAPGFSTAKQVTDISGRGVGMDVVRRNVDLLRGTLSITSREGTGTTLSVRVPLTLATLPGFGVGIGEDTYVIPLDAVVECLDLPRGTATTQRTTGVLSLREQPLPFLRLRDHFRLPDRTGCREKVVVVENAGRRVGLVIDELLGETQAVIKPLGRLFQGASSFAGSALLGDGRVALILDVPGLLRAVVPQQQGHAQADVPPPRPTVN
jgi:two-component system, chemotaxis family, sensor kinase CheA